MLHISLDSLDEAVEQFFWTQMMCEEDSVVEDADSPESTEGEDQE